MLFKTCEDKLQVFDFSSTVDNGGKTEIWHKSIPNSLKKNHFFGPFECEYHESEKIKISWYKNIRKYMKNDVFRRI